LRDGSTGRVLQEFGGDGKHHIGVALSRDGQRVLTVSDDPVTPKGIRTVLWDAVTGERLRTFGGDGDPQIGIALSSDGHRVLTLNDLTPPKRVTIILWDAVTGEKLRTLDGYGDYPFNVALSGNGQRIVTESRGATTDLWDAVTGEKLRTFGGDYDYQHPVALSDDGQRALTLSLYGKTVLWDAETGEKLCTFGGKGHTQVGVALSADGQRVATLDEEEYEFNQMCARCVLWDAGTREILRIFGGKGDPLFGVDATIDEPELGVSLSADGQRVLIVSIDHFGIIVGTKLERSLDFTLWDVGSRKRLWTFTSRTPEATSLADPFLVANAGRDAVSSDGERVLTLFTPHRLLDGRTGKLLGTFDSADATAASIVNLSDDGERLLVGFDTNTSTVWDTRKGEKLRTIESHLPVEKLAELGPDCRAALTSDGTRVLAPSADASATLWDIATGDKVRSFPGQPVALSTDGRRVVTRPNDDTLALWDTDTGEELRIVNVPKTDVVGMAVSADAVWALTRTGERRYLCKLETDTRLRTISGSTCVALSRDGKFVLTGSQWGSDAAASLSRLLRAELVHSLRGHRGMVTSVALSADARRALTGSADTTAILWDTETGEKLQTFAGHTAPVTCVAISADNRRVVTGSEDGSVRIWDGATGKELASLTSFEGGTDWLVVAPDGRFDASEGAAKFIHYRIAGTNNLISPERLEQLRKENHRPGLLAEVWKGEE